VTRPQPGAADTALALRARGHEPIVAPLLQIETLAEANPDSGTWTAILLTSANAIRGVHKFAGSAQRDVPVFAVGDATAKAARAIGFTDVLSAGGGVDELAELMTARLKPPARLLYAAGEDRAGDLAGVLRARGFEVTTVVVYRVSVAASRPNPAAAALAGEIDAVLHFSRASAEAFLKAAGNAKRLEAALKRPIHFCISESVAAPLRQAGAADIRVAGRPNEDALLELCG
jgi:uroporphyrinogen-III synthase